MLLVGSLGVAHSITLNNPPLGVRPIFNLEVVTGYGKHSLPGKPVLRGMVCEFLKEMSPPLRGVLSYAKANIRSES